MPNLENIVVQNYIGFWGIPNDYNTNGTLRMFNTKEEAIKQLTTKYIVKEFTGPNPIFGKGIYFSTIITPEQV